MHKIDVSVVGSPDQQAVLQDDLKKSPLVVGERFTEKGFDNLKKEILNYLLDHGYPKARAEGEVLLSLEADTAAVYDRNFGGAVAFWKSAPNIPAWISALKAHFKPDDIRLRPRSGF